MKVNVASSLEQNSPSVIALGANDWMVTWHGAGTGANAAISSGIFEQRFHLDNLAPTAIKLAGVSTIKYSGIIGSQFDFGALAAVDPNGESAFTYKIVNAAGVEISDSHVEIVGTPQTGFHIALKQGVTLDSSQSPQLRNFTFNIMATDPDGASSIQLMLSPAIPVPTRLPESRSMARQLTLAENDVSGRVLGVLSATDVDGVAALTYSFVDQNGAPVTQPAFEIVTAAGGIRQLKLVHGVYFDYEATPTYTLYLKVSDSAGHSTFDPITVTISNVVEAPTAITMFGPSGFYENDGAHVSQALLPVDGDKGTYTYTLISTTSADNTNPDAAALAGLFVINGENLNKIGSFNYEAYTNGTFTFKIHAEIAGAPGTAFEQTVAINVTNVNEAPTAIDFGVIGGITTAVAQNAGTGDEIAHLTARDPDFGDTFWFDLVLGVITAPLLSRRVRSPSIRANSR